MRPPKIGKKSPTCFDKTAVFIQQRQNKWEIFSNFCCPLRKAEFYYIFSCTCQIKIFTFDRLYGIKNKFCISLSQICTLGLSRILLCLSVKLPSPDLISCTANLLRKQKPQKVGIRHLIYADNHNILIPQTYKKWDPSLSTV